jgi:hypothetical protein
MFNVQQDGRLFNAVEEEGRRGACQEINSLQAHSLIGR